MDGTLWHAPQEPPGSAACRVWDWYSNVSHERHNRFTAIAGVRRLLQRVVLAGTVAWALVTSAVTSGASTRPEALPHEPLKVGMDGPIIFRDVRVISQDITSQPSEGES